MRHPPQTQTHCPFLFVYSVVAAGLTLSTVCLSLCVTSSPLCDGWVCSRKGLF